MRLSRGFQVTARDTVVALIPAVLLGLYARYPGLWWVAWVALTPWVFLFTRARPASWLLYLPAAWLTWLALYPQAARYGWQASLLFAAVGCLPWLPFAPALARVHGRLRLPRALTVPVLWCGVEWLRLALTPGHFDLYLLGYSQAEIPVLTQVAAVLGVWGVSFPVAAVNGLIVDLALAPGASRLGSAWRPSLAVGLGLVGAVLFGALRLARAPGEETGIRVALVQPNKLHTPRNHRGVHLAQALLTAGAVPTGAVDLIVWPENSILTDLRGDPAYLDDLRWLAASKDAALLVGAPLHGADGRVANSAWLMLRDGRLAGRYDKRVLFPWSEYVPLDRWLARRAPGIGRLQRRLVRSGWGFLPMGRPGDEATVLTLPRDGAEARFGVLICVENAWPPLVAELTRRAVSFVVHITSEGEVGGPVQTQLLRIARLRAVESGRPYVRVGNTGVSCVIDPLGRVAAVLTGRRGERTYDAGVMLAGIPAGDRSPTLYALSHDAFIKGCLVLGVVFLIAAAVRRPGRGEAR